MRRLSLLARSYLWEVFHIFFRHYNFPCELGLRRIGNPDQRSPVFVSGNYTLTVQRLLRVLDGLDCYLLVANSRGSNVWCAAGMNEYTEHDIIDAVNVADLKSVVKHRRLIMPPYAAPGVDTRAVKRETGFHTTWGPTHLRDIRRYVANGFKRTNDMVVAQFGLADRMEQALSTSLAYSLTIAVLALLWPRLIFGTMGLVFYAYVGGFALWDVLPQERQRRKTATLAAVLMAGLALLGLARGWALRDYLTWEGLLAVVTLLMAMDGCGSQATFKTTLGHWLQEGNYESLFDPVVDPKKCTSCMECVIVCPKNVYAGRGQDGAVVSTRPDACIECLACVKQCADDAIYNRSGKYKGDVKSIPGLHEIMTRSWAHLAEEDRWIGASTHFRSGLPFVTGEQSRVAGAVPPGAPEPAPLGARGEAGGKVGNG